MANQKHSNPQPSPDHSLMGSTLAQVKDADAWWADKSCLIFMTLTCVRSKEAREAIWDEVDMDADTWIIPGSRRKTNVSHRVPLSTQAKEILDHARTQTDPSESRIFPPQRGSEYIRTTNLSKLLRKLEIPASSVGFRGSFLNWAREQVYIPEHVASMALGLLPPAAVRKLHRPVDFFQERQTVMQEWADYLTETMGPVTPTMEE